MSPYGTIIAENKETCGIYKQLFQTTGPMALMENKLKGNLSVKQRIAFSEEVNPHHRELNVANQKDHSNHDDAVAQYNTGVDYHIRGALEKATEHYRRAIILCSDLVEAYFNLGNALIDLSRPGEAVAAYLKALEIKPDYAQAAYNIGNILKKTGRFDQALSAYRHALNAKPDYAAALNNMGVIYRDNDQLDQAISCLEQAIAIDPMLVEAHYNLGVVWHKKGEYKRGLKHFQNALDCVPDYAPARWLQSLSLPMLYDSSQEIDNQRRKFSDNLDLLIQSTPLETEQQKRHALQGIASTTNFYLQYQGRNDVMHQKKYGRFVAKVMAANYPQWSRARFMPPIKPGEKIRIGYVSSLMHTHTIGVFLLGWISNHSPDFEIYCYHLGDRQDALTDQLRQLVHVFHYFPGDIDAACRQIITDQLHILVHTDIGMNPVTLQLAALRLAPVQCKGWGHPVTTGLPTIDYYLSSDLMEPENAQIHYSEKLIRLPNLALCYSPPELPNSPKPRSAFQIPEKAVVYLSTQSLFKYLPQHDDIYPQIATQVPQACFVFISHSSNTVTEQFKARLARVFHQYNRNADRHCIFVPRMNHNDFLSLNLAADVLLDTLDWSGGKTSLEALSYNLPVVTCPGELMRGRHTYAFLNRINLTSTIADDKAGYIKIAVRLGIDRHFRCAVRDHIAANKPLLYDDQKMVRSLEEFFRKLCWNEMPSTCSVRRINPVRRNTHLFDSAPAFQLYQEGLTYIDSQNWSSALDAFQRALAWIPNFLAVAPWFQSYLLDNQPVPAYTAEFASKVYSCAAQCYLNTNRYADSIQYSLASLNLDPGNKKAAAIRRFAADSRLHSLKPQVSLQPKMGNGFNQTRQSSLPQLLSILLITHVSEKLQRNAHFKAPSVGLVETTYVSACSVLGPQLSRCPKYLCYDKPVQSSNLEKKYDENLARFAERHSFHYQTYNHDGLQAILKDAVERISTPFLLFIEHDWQFQPPEVDTETLVHLLSCNPGINYLRFNKRLNIISNYDFLTESDAAYQPFHFLRSVCHSNNPSIWRVSKLKNDWMPVCVNDPVYQNIELGGKAYGLKEPLFKQRIQDVRNMGFFKAHEKWGTFIFGAYETAPKIIHLGE